MSTVSRLRGAGIAIATAQDCIERMRLAVATAEDALRSVHRTAPISLAIERLGVVRDLSAQICATLPDSAPIFQEAELAQAIERTEHRSPAPCNA